MNDSYQPQPSSQPRPRDTARFRTDCSNCRALCCIAIQHRSDNGCAADKAPDTPCRNLTGDFRCVIFTSLEAEGYTFCRAYECRGAGQLVSRFVATETTAEALAGDTGHMNDFRQLSRLHMLIWALGDLEDPDADALAAELVAVSENYEGTGQFIITPPARDALIANQSLVERVLEHIGRKQRH